jgi:hypothetical protein
MAILKFGERNLFALEVGPPSDDRPTMGMRDVDIWAAGIELTCDDNSAFVPQFCMSVEATITWLLSDDDRSMPYPELTLEENHRRLRAEDYGECSPFFFMDWGPTTDNLANFLFRRGSEMLLTFEFWRAEHPRPSELGKVFVVAVPERKLIRCLHQAVCVLRSGASRRTHG